MIDWKSRLRERMRGIAVEGNDDKLVLEAFLKSGETAGLWQNWQTKLEVVVAGGFQSVLAELNADYNQFDIWAVLDRAWRPDTEIQEMLNRYAKLRFLPRRMVENYAIDPDEVWLLLPAFQQNKLDRVIFQERIVSNVEAWVTHGTLLQTLYEPSQYFGRPAVGYPNELTQNVPIKDDHEIAALLTLWRDKLDPERIMAEYRQTRSAFNTTGRSDQYRLCIDGKMFFNRLFPDMLNQLLGQKNDNKKWFYNLFKPPEGFSAPCPDDLKGLLVELVS